MEGNEIRQIVLRVARRMFLARLAESVAICATAGAVAGAAFVAAWSIGRVEPAWAMAICLAPIVCGAVLFLQRCRGAAGLSLSQAICVFVVLAGLNLASLVEIRNGSFTGVPRWYGFIICLGTAIIFGAMVELFAGLRPLAAAIEVDMRADLKEQFATAAELSLKGGEPDAISECISRRAADAAQKAGLQEKWFWHRKPATLAALGLSCCLAAAMGMLPVLGLGDENSQASKTAKALMSLPDNDVNRILDSLSSRSKQDDQIARTLDATAKVINFRDEKQLADLIAKLEKMGFKLTDAIPPDIRRQLAEKTAGGGGGGQGNQTNNGGSTASTNQASQAEQKYSESFVAAPPESVKARSISQSQTQIAPSKRLPAFVNFPSAWSDARRRATDLLAGGKIPPEYRQLVRDFFDAGE